MNQSELKQILEKHRLWLNNEEGGGRANLSRADLSYANLRSADLRYADLSSADLRSADLSYADLSYADLRSADLRYAALSSADLRSADLSSADLSYANLRSADLRYADLSSADLRSAIGNLQQIKSLFLDRWPVTYTAEILQIGCQRHPVNDWFSFDDDRISKMDAQALEWWGKYRDLIKQTIELSPAQPTNHENKEGKESD